MSRSARRRGFTLVELLLVMSMALVHPRRDADVVHALLPRREADQTLNDSPQVARNAMDIASRQLRNLANQDPSQQTTTIARAQPYDLVFQTSDPSRKWVRYCLDTTATGGRRHRRVARQLWESETATAAAPTAG